MCMETIFYLLRYQAQEKRDFRCAAAPYAFHYCEYAYMGVPPNLPIFRGLTYVSVCRYCYNLQSTHVSCLMTYNYILVIMMYCTLRGIKSHVSTDVET